MFTADGYEIFISYLCQLDVSNFQVSSEMI